MRMGQTYTIRSTKPKGLPLRWIGVGLILLGLSSHTAETPIDEPDLSILVQGSGFATPVDLSLSGGFYVISASGEVDDGQLRMMLRAENLSNAEKIFAPVTVPVDRPDGEWVLGRTFAQVSGSGNIEMEIPWNHTESHSGALASF